LAQVALKLIAVLLELQVISIAALLLDMAAALAPTLALVDHLLGQAVDLAEQ
jgi:hypothetical protein